MSVPRLQLVLTKDRRRLFSIGLVVVFLLAVLPRLYYPCSRYLDWYDRSVNFYDALSAGDFEATYQQYHPGVTTMWVAGLGMRLYMWANGWSSDQLLHPPAGMSGPQGGPAQAAAAALGFAVALCIVLVYVLLVRTTSWPVAFSAGCLLALDPFYLTHSRMIHVDALLASFMLVSTVSFVSHLRKERLSDLILSGAFAGLAFLTKSPSLFLMPFAVLATVYSGLTGEDSASRHPSGLRTDVRFWTWRLGRSARLLGIWIVVALAVFVLVWPAMWVAPLGTLTRIADSVQHHATTPHPSNNFFAGRVTDSLGLLYYLASLGWKTTWITLPASCATALLLILRRRQRECASPIGYLAVYALGFLLLMTIAAKKWSRYILPTFVALDVLAGWGLVQVARLIGERRSAKKRQDLTTAAIVALALTAQAISVLRFHPYYGAHHNLLLGGSKVACHFLHVGDQGEGLDLAAEFLNSHAVAGGITAGVQDVRNLMFSGKFAGDVVPIAHSEADYRVFFIHYAQRNKGVFRWEDIKAAYNEPGDPVWAASFDGVPYVWITQVYPDDPEAFQIDNPLRAKLGNRISLLGYELHPSQPGRSDTLTVTLFWQSMGGLSADYHVFVHVQNQDGLLVAQHDGVPSNGKLPTWRWQEDEVIRDRHELTLDKPLAEGNYTLSVGMYDYRTGVRLPAAGPAGQDWPEGRIVLQELEIGSLK